MNRRAFLGWLAGLTGTIAVVGPAALANIERWIPTPAATGRVYLKKILCPIEMTEEVMRRIRAEPGAFIAYVERCQREHEEHMNQALITLYGGGGR